MNARALSRHRGPHPPPASPGPVPEPHVGPRDTTGQGPRMKGAVVDPILHSFLAHEHEKAMRLARQSDILDLEAMDTPPHQRYLARYRCKGLVRREDGAITTCDEFIAGIILPDDYLRRVDAMRIVHLLTPGVWHPNIQGPVICLGRLREGTALVDILMQVYEILTYQKATMREDDALNHQACAYARSHGDRFPLDRRPLRRSAMKLSLTALDPAGRGAGGPHVG